MNVRSCCLPGSMRSLNFWIWVALTIAALAIAGCGGGAGQGSNNGPPAAQCVPGDPATASECGTLYLGLTDADGDFMNYSVDVLSLTLEKANGAVVETMPASARINFVEYVDLTELLAVAAVPPGTYVAGTITLDYSNAEVIVDAGGAAKAATVVDGDGDALGTTSLKIVLSEREQLFITKGRASFLSIDFDLEASHTVDVNPTPALAAAEPYIIAELNPLDSKDIRVRGRLLEVDVAEMWYAVAVRPFYAASGDYGRMRVNVTDQTEFEVNEQHGKGEEGLRLLDAAGQGTITVAQGTLNLGDRRFTADIVLAGSSVPGVDKDAAWGTVIARAGNELTVRGGAVILTDASATVFRDDITVTVGPETIVYKTYVTDRPLGIHDRLLDIGAISPGQVVTVRGTVTRDDALGVHIDATEGAVLMHVTRLTGLVNAIVPGQIDVDLHTIGRVRAAAVDFTCTGGCEPGTDADPHNYEVSTGNLWMDAGATGKPVAALGFPSEFGAAPPDFEGRTIIDYSDVRSVLGVGWGATGTASPFTMIGSDGLLLDNQNPDIDVRHHIKQGPVLIDLTQLGSDTLIAPRETGSKLFSILTRDSLRLYADFDDFADALVSALDGATTARSMYARGLYDADSNVFTAYKIGIYLLEP